MVKNGRLRAELREGPRGPCYYVDESEIRTAQEITDVVPVVRPVSVEALADTVAARVADIVGTRVQEAFTKAMEASAEEQASTRAEVEALRQELAATREAQERIEKAIEERDRRLMEALRKLTEKRERRPWWRRLLKGGR